MKNLIALLFLVNFAFANSKVVVLSPAINEIVFALGKGDTIIANTDFSNYPKESQDIPKIGGYFEVNLEKLISLKPDMVMLQDPNKALIKKFEKLNIKYMILRLNNLEDIAKSIEKIAQYYGEAQKKEQILNSIQDRLKSLENIVKGQKILIVIGVDSNLSKPIFIIGKNTYLDEIIKKSDNSNAYSSNKITQSSLNLESIINLNPDIIVFLAPYLKDTQEKDKILQIWKNLPISASKKSKIYIINKEYAGIPSHRIIYFINDFKEILEDAKNK